VLRFTVRRKRTGNTGSSIICCITTARISDRKTSVIWKHMPIAVEKHEYERIDPKTPRYLPSMALFTPISFSE
jgi:hypothetical protein